MPVKSTPLIACALSFVVALVCAIFVPHGWPVPSFLLALAAAAVTLLATWTRDDLVTAVLVALAAAVVAGAAYVAPIALIVIALVSIAARSIGARRG